jgi:flagellar assembly factor FliW
LIAVMTETALPELTLTGGLAGFPDTERYALVELPEASPLFLLRSLDEPGLEFVVAPPAVFFSDYAPELDDATVERLGIADGADVLLLVVLTVGSGIDTATANLLAPIVINQRTRTAAQAVVQGNWPLRAPLRRVTG